MQRISGPALTAMVLAGLLMECAVASGASPVETPYLLGFTFQGSYSFRNRIPADRLQVFNAGAFDGWALIYSWNYGAGLAPPPEDLTDEIAWYRQHLAPGKHIWPSVSFSRMIQPAGDYLPGETIFHRIPGIDLENEAGVRDIFETEWRNACVLARQLGSPGIMFDPEWYGNGNVRFPEELAKERGEDVATTLAKCRALGARLADITYATYPGCHVFSLYTGFFERKEHWTTIAHVHLGFIQQAKQRGLDVKLIDGGELGLGYLATSLAAYQERILNRWIETRHVIETYPHYEPAGVLAPWVDRDQRSAWASDHRVGPEEKPDDFVPHFRAMFRNYRFSWIYGTHTGEKTGFNPWGTEHAIAMGAALERARRTTQYAPPDLSLLPPRRLPEGDRGWTAYRLSRMPRAVFLDWADPGAATIRFKYHRGQDAVPKTTTLATETREGNGRQWLAAVTFDRSELSRELKRWPGTGITATNLPRGDASVPVTLWTEIFNPGTKPIGIRVTVFDATGEAVVTNAYDAYATGGNISPGESRILFCQDLTSPIEAISLSSDGQPEEQMTVYVGPVYRVVEGK